MISVIIPVKNAADHLGECLQGALCQKGLRELYEVIVVDDNSTDTTPRVAEEMGVRLIRQDSLGPAAARNAGARAAKGEILAFTDSDCVPTPEWLFHLTQPFQNADIVGTKGTYTTDQHSLVARFVQEEYEFKYARMSRQAYIDFIDTSSAAYRRGVFLQNGGFETSFPVPSVEDQEFSFRLARKGYRMVFAPRAVVQHQHDRHLGEYIKRKYNIGYWKAVMLRWLPEKAFADSHTPASQRWQIPLLGAALLFFSLTLLLPDLWWLSVGSLALFFLTALSFLVHILMGDNLVLSVAVPLLICRAGALGMGLLVGFLFPPTERPRPLYSLSPITRILKRFMDIAGAVLGFAIFAPLIAISTVAIKLEDGGPVFYIQERLGEGGQPFQLVKLRTMIVGAEQLTQAVLKSRKRKGLVHKPPNDPRVTRVGRVLRRWSVDEVPQFWNVLRGEMSLVGPRPEEPWVVAGYNDKQRQRLAVKPGMTGPMQIAGRGELNIEVRVQMDLDYINHYSLWKDLVILVKTLPAIISGEGAY